MECGNQIFYEALSLFLTTLTALLAAYIAARQWKTAEAQKKASLFTLRHEIYMDVLNVCNIILQSPGSNDQETERFFYLIRNKAPFLFDKKVTEFIESLYRDKLIFDEAKGNGIPFPPQKWKEFRNKFDDIRNVFGISLRLN